MSAVVLQSLHSIHHPGVRGNAAPHHSQSITPTLGPACSDRFLGIILRVLRLEVSIYNVYIQTSFKPLLFKGRGKNPLVEVIVNSKKEIWKFLNILS
jgi:hypothetical protein